MESFQVLIVGGGASGLCAAIAAKRAADVSVLVLEKDARPGQKILVTGNGKCNLGNRDRGLRFYHKNHGFIDRVFSRVSPDDSLLFLRSIGVPVCDDGSGRLYPLSRRASAVADALCLEAERLGVYLRCSTPVFSIQQTKGGYLVNRSIFAETVVIAVGGCAGPHAEREHGARGLAKELGIRFEKTYPGLCALMLDGSYPASLKGVRHLCGVELSDNGEPFFSTEGEVQFNEKGVSGIPILQGSLAASERLMNGGAVVLTLDLLKDFSIEELFGEVAARVERMRDFPAERLFTAFLPKMLWLAALKRAGFSPQSPLPTDEETVSRLVKEMKYCSFSVTGTAGFRDAQISGGGFSTEDFSAQTLEHRRLKRLFACGEALDVQGLCGGYNLTWAWCSGRLAGRSAGLSLKK